MPAFQYAPALAPSAKDDAKWLLDEADYLLNATTFDGQRLQDDAGRIREIGLRHTALVESVSSLSKEVDSLRSEVTSSKRETDQLRVQLAAQVAQTPQPQVAIQQQSTQQPTTNVVQQPVKNTGLIVAGVAVFAGLVGVGVWWWYRNQKVGARV